MKRFIIDSDGTNFIVGSLTDNVEENVKKEVLSLPENMTTYMICPNIGGKFFNPTNIGEVYNNPRLVLAHEKGLDPFEMLIDAVRNTGKEVFITYRMNDVHDANNPNSELTSVFKKENPQYTVGYTSISENSKDLKEIDWMDYCLDYSIPQVQDYILNTIKELIDNYNIDGLQLDWVRFPRHLSGSLNEVWQKCSILTDFTAKVRKLLDNKNKKIKLSARIPTTLKGCKHMGLDIAKWTELGLIDMFVISPFLTTDYKMPVKEFKERIGDSQIPVYTAIEFNHAGQPHCPESLKASILSLMEDGTDGIYFFNFSCWIEYLCARPYHWLRELDKEEGAAKKPLLFSVTNKKHRVKNVDMEGMLPLDANTDSGGETSIYLPQKAFPIFKAILLVQAEGEFEIYINKTNLRRNIGKTYRQPYIFLEYNEFYNPVNNIVNAENKEEMFCYEINETVLHPGKNSILIKTKEENVRLKRINLGLW